jgi:tetratricopeptide (TPR) repeat protein
LSNKGQLIRRLRMLREISPSKLVTGISSLSYLSLMEGNKRAVPPKIFLKIMNRLGLGPDSRPDFDFFRVIPDAAFELVNTYRSEGEFSNSLATGENFLRGISSQIPEFELQMVRLRGSLMNSALELCDFDRALQLLSLALPVTSSISRVYSDWSYANYFEVTGDVRSAMNFYGLALASAQDSVDLQTRNDLRQGFINSKLQIDDPCVEGDFEFLNDCVADYLHNHDISRLVLTRMTLAWYYFRHGQSGEALKLVEQCEVCIPEFSLELYGSVAESIADLCLLLDRMDTATRILALILARAESSDSSLVRELIWTRIGNAGKKSGSVSIVDACDSALRKLAA